MISRRILLKTTAAATLLPMLGRAQTSWRQAAEESPLIYLTPLQSNGAESACQAEIWFAAVEGDFYVVTPADAWRSQAIGKGLTRTRIWVGDVGMWKDSDRAYKSLPMLEAEAGQETDAAVQEKVLEAMGGKYSGDGWGRWGPRFRNGLADGSRVMLRYGPA